MGERTCGTCGKTFGDLTGRGKTCPDCRLKAEIERQEKQKARLEENRRKKEKRIRAALESKRERVKRLQAEISSLEGEL